MNAEQKKNPQHPWKIIIIRGVKIPMYVSIYLFYLADWYTGCRIPISNKLPLCYLQWSGRNCQTSIMQKALDLVNGPRGGIYVLCVFGYLVINSDIMWVECDDMFLYPIF